MIIEANSIPSGEVIQADLCIVGAGPAGLTLASEFLGTEYRVFLLEAGGRRIDDRARDLGDGEVIGHPYFPLSEASGYSVGGSTHLWDEWMRARPLDPIDFERRPWVEESGWPFGREALHRYYEQSNHLLGLGPFDYDPPDSTSRPDSLLHLVSFRYSNTFDFEGMARKIESSPNVGLVLNASALELELSDDRSRIARIVASYENPHRFYVRSKAFVLAAGGLGNPRLLLLSQGANPKGVANSSGLVGAYFMEHPTVRRGVVIPDEEPTDDFWKFFSLNRHGSEAFRGAFAPSVLTMEESGTLNGMILLTESDLYRSSETLRSIAMVRDGVRGRNLTGENSLAHAFSLFRHPRKTFSFLRQMRGRESRRRALQVSVTVEQAPRRSSRVTLGRSLDRFGRRRIALDWRLGEVERSTVLALQASLHTLLSGAGYGRLEGLLGEEWPRRVFRGEWHQMGTTRMSSSARAGVVDPRGKTHDVDNLYIAGGSVFPTVGYANPTLTIVAMTLRLADELKKRLGKSASLGPLW